MTLAEKLCMWKFEGAGLRTLPHRNYLGWKFSIRSLSAQGWTKYRRGLRNCTSQPSASILARLLINESSFRTREPARSRFHRDRSAIERYRSFRRMVLLHVHPSVVYTRRRNGWVEFSGSFGSRGCRTLITLRCRYFTKLVSNGNICVRSGMERNIRNDVNSIIREPRIAAWIRADL